MVSGTPPKAGSSAQSRHDGTQLAAAKHRQYAGGGADQPSALNEAASAPQGISGTAGSAHPATPAATGGSAVVGNGSSVNPATVVNDDHDKLGRNDPCWCGSGKKYKKCHGA